MTRKSDLRELLIEATDEPQLTLQPITEHIKTVASEPTSLVELFERLKEFDNKVLLERVSVLERSIGLIYKEQVNIRAMLKEIQQIVSFLSVAQEELLNNFGVSIEAVVEDDAPTDEEVAHEAEQIATQNIKDGKKWN